MGIARITASSSFADGSGVLFTLLTASTDGTRVDAVRFRNSQTTAAISSNMVHRVFYSATTTSGSATCRLVGEVATATATRSATAVGATSIITFDQPLILPSGSALFVGQSVYASAADQFDAQAFAGNY